MPEADVETSSMGRGVDKDTAMAHYINLSPRIEDWLTVKTS